MRLVDRGAPASKVFVPPLFVFLAVILICALGVEFGEWLYELVR